MLNEIVDSVIFVDLTGVDIVVVVVVVVVAALGAVLIVVDGWPFSVCFSVGGLVGTTAIVSFVDGTRVSACSVTSGISIGAK